MRWGFVATTQFELDHETVEVGEEGCAVHLGNGVEQPEDEAEP